MPYLSDTSGPARELQDDAVRRLSGAERVVLACEMSDLVRELACASLRREHPEWTRREVVAELARRTLPPSVLPPEFQ